MVFHLSIFISHFVKKKMRKKYIYILVLQLSSFCVPVGHVDAIQNPTGIQLAQNWTW